MQRITRYPLLLRQIAKYTNPDQDLSKVQTALTDAENTVARINEEVRDAESTERLRVLSEDLWVGGEGRIDLTEPSQYQGARKLIREGNVLKAKSGRRLWMVLCTDVLILIESRNLYRMPIPLHDLTLQQGRDDVSFALVIAYGGKHDQVRLKAPSSRERVEWIASISKARKECLAARQAAKRQSRASVDLDWTRGGPDGAAAAAAGGMASPRPSRPSSNRNSTYTAYSLPENQLEPVYDDSHSYAGQRHSMYDHQF